MRFEIEDTFAASRAELEALLEDPELYPRMARDLPGLERIELLAQDEADDVVRRRVRYTPAGVEARLPAAARGRLTAEMMVWVEESRFFRREHRLEYRVEPNLPDKWREKFTSHGEFTFAELDGGGVRRRIGGDVTVRMPLVGGLIERRLVQELRASFRAEAALLAGWLEERRAGSTGGARDHCAAAASQ
jgi:hypothetical protein